MKSNSSSNPTVPQNKKRDWDSAIAKYNVPKEGIRVAIPGDYKPRETYNNKPAPQNTRIKPKTVLSPTPPKPRKTLHAWAVRSLILGLGFAAFGNLPVYSMITKTDKSVLTLTDQPDSHSPAQILKDLHLPAVSIASYSGYASDILPDATQGNWVKYIVTDADDLASALEFAKAGQAAKTLLDSPDIKTELSPLKSGATLLSQTDEGQLKQLIYVKDDHNAYIVSLTDGKYVGKWDNSLFEVKTAKTAFTIQHSLLQDGKQVGLSNSLIHQLTQVFGKDFDLKRDVHVGDKIGVIFNEFCYQGERIYTDKILAASYQNRANEWQRIRYTLNDGRTDYFRPNDELELKQIAFDKTPIDGARLTSEFGVRVHPVFGFLKMHTGLDYAAPYGTPIHATADGIVESVGRQSGYGNLVKLRHINSITTLYGHMSAFKEGLASGDTVKRGDVIGYVGSTGTSTGNHVHYEYRINGEPQDPSAVDLPQIGIMTAREMQDFKTYAREMTNELNNLQDVASMDKLSTPTTN